MYLELHADTLNFMPAQNLYKKGEIMLCNLKCSRVSLKNDVVGFFDTSKTRPLFCRSFKPCNLHK